MKVGKIKIDKNNILNSETFEELFNISDFKERQNKENELLKVAKEYKKATEFKKILEKEKSKYIKKGCTLGDRKLDFGEKAKIRYMKAGEYSQSQMGIFTYNGNKVCSQLIEPITIYENIESSEEKVKCAFLSGGKWKYFIADRLTLSHNGKIVNLANKGLDVTSDSARFLVKYLNDMLTLNVDIIPIKKSTSKLGWSGNNFIPYDGNIEFDGDDNFRKCFNSVKEEGDYNKWLAEMYNVRKNKVVRIIQDTSFASVLLKKLKKQSFVTMLWGTTGDGKTVAGMTAMSIWGNPEKGNLMFTLNNTDNFYYRIADLFNDIPVFFDELQTYRGDINKLIMNICEGIDRGKAKADGGVQSSNTWNNAFIMTGEQSASSFNSDGGALNRLIEINSDGKIIENGHKTVSVIKENYGFAGKKFIEYIKDFTKEELEGLYEQKCEELRSVSNTEEKQIFSMAMILLADELSRMCIFEKDKQLTAEDVKEYMFTKDDIDSSERAYKWFINYCILYKRNFNIVNNNGTEGNQTVPSTGEFWGEIGNYEIVINKAKFDFILRTEGFNSKKVIKDWSKKEYIEKNSQGRNSNVTSINGIKASYVTVKIKKDFREEK